jgi:hypothetical protein
MQTKTFMQLESSFSYSQTPTQWTLSKANEWKVYTVYNWKHHCKTLDLTLYRPSKSVQFGLRILVYNVTCTPIARQRLGKHIPAKRKSATEGRPLLGNRPLNMSP